MAADPQNGTVTMVGRSGTIYTISCYFTDVTTELVTFSTFGVASATSDKRWTAPEDCVLTDLFLDAQPDDCLHHLIMRNGIVVNQVLRDNHIMSVTNRPVLRIPFKKGDYLNIEQLT